MTTDSFSWLHLTDLHYGLRGQDCLWPTLRQPWFEDLAALHERCGPWDAVLFTGDLVQSGESAQFKEMQTEVFEPLWEALARLDSGDAVLLAAPGNHDLYRPRPEEDDAAVDRLLEKDGFTAVADKFWRKPNGPYRRVVTHAFAAYSEWWSAAPRRPAIVEGALPGDFSASLPCGDRRIGIVGLNTAFLQLGGGDYRERLVWNAHQLHAVCDRGVDVWTGEHDVCLLLTHHGPDWLTPAARAHGEIEIAPAGRFALHLYGHQHENEIEYVRRGGSRDAVRRCQGCSVFGMEKFGEPPTMQRAHGYCAGRISFDGDDATLRLWPRVATSKTGRWRFVPDQENAELEDDQGTAAEPIATRPRAKASPAPKVSPRSAGPKATPTASVAMPHSTLPSRRPFFGRGKDLAKVARYLDPEDRSWGVVIDGPGGVGKTALALEAAHRAPAEHFALKLWITAKNRELHPEGERALHDVRMEDFDALLNEIGRALGRDDIPKAIPEDRPALVRHALASHRALLVLDNLETLRVQERRRVFELLGNLPASCRAIVTSRRRTDGSFAAHVLRLDKLERDATDELLAELGQRWAPIARLTTVERDRLYAETGGNPLLLTWTAGQLGRTTGRCRTVEEAVERLQEAHRLGEAHANNDPLGYVFGDLVETFTADETAVLAALVHFTRPAPIEWIVPLTESSRRAVETALDGLRDRALLIEDDEAATWLLPPLAAHFLRRSCPEAVGLSSDRLAERTYALVVENGYDQYDRFSAIEEVWPQVAAALPILITGDNRRLQIACDALRDFLDFSGRWDDWLLLSTTAEAEAEQAKDFVNAAWRAYDVGWCHVLRGQSSQVLNWADRARVHFQAANESVDHTSILRGRGHALAEDYSSAITAYREGLELERSISPKNPNMVAQLIALADALHNSGKLDDAETYYREALGLAKALGDAEGVAIIVINRAELALERGQWSDAEQLAREALSLAEEIGRKELIALGYTHLANALAGQGRGAEGHHHAKRAVMIFEELRAPALTEALAALERCSE